MPGIEKWYNYPEEVAQRGQQEKNRNKFTLRYFGTKLQNIKRENLKINFKKCHIYQKTKQNPKQLDSQQQQRPEENEISLK